MLVKYTARMYQNGIPYITYGVSTGNHWKQGQSFIRANAFVMESMVLLRRNSCRILAFFYSIKNEYFPRKKVVKSICVTRDIKKINKKDDPSMPHVCEGSLFN